MKKKNTGVFITVSLPTSLIKKLEQFGITPGPTLDALAARLIKKDHARLRTKAAKAA